MSPGKKKSEGIALLSIYGDEDDEDMYEDDVNDPDPQPEPEPGTSEHHHIHVDLADNTTEQQQQEEEEEEEEEDGIHFATTPALSNDNLTPHSDSNVAVITRKARLTIVDYAHDELALSPEAEVTYLEGEIVASGRGRVMFGEELHTTIGDLQEKVPTGTPTAQGSTPQSSEQLISSHPDEMDYAMNESEFAKVEESVEGCVEEPRDVDPLDKFLPPPPKAKCSDELQEKIIKFLSLKKTTGRSFNAEVRNRKEYRNPDFLLHAVTYQDIDQIGSCFSKDVFDPHEYDKSDYYDEIEADMKHELEKKEQEKKKSQKVEYVSGGTQPGVLMPVPKVNMPISGPEMTSYLYISSMVAGGLHSVPASTDALTRDSRQNKKSKWDKVDGDRKHPLPSGGQDSLSSVGANAALLSAAANVGTGYPAFAQQRRREAEERRSSDKKLERRS
ncbi:hypothetical protein RJ639_044401 [Escallonia herrerae]|uniref:SAP30-binding protein n=1 Tax=Escallonia herrerae TaxID=1293975 RepID=A0AA88W9X9_9ASTE|nr:hypothetical protein RJ639_044401 [Escallonia herrerae]